MLFGRMELGVIRVWEANMRKYLKIYQKIAIFALMKSMAYPQDFLIWSIVDFTWTMVGLGFFRILLLRTPTISGWTFNELTLLMGMVNIVGAFIWGLMYGNMKELVRDIHKGNLDVYLTKPINSQFIVSTKEISFSLFPKLITGIFLVGYGLTVNSKYSLIDIGIVLVSILSATLASYALYFITTTCALLFGRLRNIAELVPHSLDIASYPTNIFSPVMQFIFTFILPFALMGFLPASILLGRINYHWLLSIPAVTITLLVISNRFWQFALRHYSSASS